MHRKLVLALVLTNLFCSIHILGAVEQRSINLETQADNCYSSLRPQGPAPACESWLQKETERARGLFELGRTRQAKVLFQKILAISLHANDTQGQADAHLGLAAIAARHAEVTVAGDECEKAKALFEQLSDRPGVARVQNLLGFMAAERGDEKMAHDFYIQALQEFEAANLQDQKALTLLNIGSENTKFTEDVRKLDEEAAEIAKRSGNKRIEGIAHRHLGWWLYHHGNLEMAQKEYREAEALLKEANSRDDLAHVYRSEAILLEDTGHAEEGVRLSRNASKLAMDSEDRALIIAILNVEAHGLAILDNWRQACTVWKRTLALAQTANLINSIEATESNLGGCLVEVHNYRGAVRQIEAALRVHPNSYHAQYWFSVLTGAYFNLGQYSLALEAATKSVELVEKQGTKRAIPIVLTARAQVENKLNQDEAALADAHSALNALEDLRAHLAPSDFMKRGFSDNAEQVVGVIIDLLHKSKRYDEALAISETSRARAFLDLVASRSEENQPTTNETVQGDRQPAGITPVLAKPGTSKSLDHPVERHSTEAQSELNLVANLASEFPSLASADPLSLDGIKGVASRLHSSIVSYWVEPDATYIWVVAPSGEIHSTRIDIKSSRLKTLVQQLWSEERASLSVTPRGGIAKGAPAQAAPMVKTRGGALLKLASTPPAAWRRLYKLLIEPVDSWLPASGSRLTIVPHGPLLLLPFAGLRDGGGHYLIERFALNYSPSVSLLRFTERESSDARQRPRRFLLIADPSGLRPQSNAEILPRLPYAQLEVSGVAKMVPRSDTTILKGTEASERHMLDLATDATVIHLATHAIAYGDKPFESFLALNPIGSATQGRLTAREIYDLRLHADLVFLSACRSAAGKVSGDGVIGLTRAFLTAGTASVIAPLWDVADQPTSRLVIDFYRNWLRDGDKMLALRAAQLHLMRELREGKIKIPMPSGDLVLPEAPTFWASFILLGEP